MSGGRRGSVPTEDMENHLPDGQPANRTDLHSMSGGYFSSVLNTAKTYDGGDDAGGPEAELEDADENSSSSKSVTARRAAARQRQVDIGKARIEYVRYIAFVPKEHRTPTRPRTPDISARVSKRQFDRQLSEWRRLLHEYDDPDAPPEDEPDGTFGLGPPSPSPYQDWSIADTGSGLIFEASLSSSSVSSSTSAAGPSDASTRKMQADAWLNSLRPTLVELSSQQGSSSNNGAPMRDPYEPMKVHEFSVNSPSDPLQVIPSFDGSPPYAFGRNHGDHERHKERGPPASPGQERHERRVSGQERSSPIQQKLHAESLEAMNAALDDKQIALLESEAHLVTSLRNLAEVEAEADVRRACRNLDAIRNGGVTSSGVRHQTHL